MKKQLIFVLALSALPMFSCEEEPVIQSKDIISTPAVTITGFYPESAASGATVTLFGANFSTTLTDNYVTFDGTSAAVIQAYTGTIVVRVPENLAPGDYTISLSVLGQLSTAPHTFRVVDVRF